IGSANHNRMTQAALAVLIPLIAKGENGAGHATGAVYHTDSASSFGSAYDDVKGNQDDVGLPWVEVMVCSPNKQLLNDDGDSGEDISFDAKDTITDQEWKGFDKTRLSIQVTFNYRMVIPFAN